MIRNLFRKLFHKEIESVKRELQKEVEDLRITAESLKDEVTKISGQISQSSQILTTMGMTESNKPWWKDDDILYDRDTPSDVRVLAYKIESDQKRQYALTHPSLKQRAVYHGGCLGCMRPLNKGLGDCGGCQYFERDWSFPNKYMQ